MSKPKPEKVSTSKHKAQPPMTSEQVNQQLNLGVKHLQTGKMSGAEACFQQVLQWQPDNADAWHLLGVIAVQRKQYPTAIEKIERALQLKPDYPDAHYNLGIALKEQGSLEEAIALMKREGDRVCERTV